jgi:transcription termination factor NusA
MCRKNLMCSKIDQLDIAEGIKELLINKGFTNSNEIIDIDLDELTDRLGIDQDIAKLVRFAAKNN